MRELRGTAGRRWREGGREWEPECQREEWTGQRQTNALGWPLVASARHANWSIHVRIQALDPPPQKPRNSEPQIRSISEGVLLVSRGKCIMGEHISITVKASSKVRDGGRALVSPAQPQSPLTVLVLQSVTALKVSDPAKWQPIHR